ncbi:MAG: ribosome maturation factor RimM [Fermentimonas sp.]|jgi:16S rRNA processing protein RimM
MIHEKDIVPVGRTRKPYGIRGEIVLFFHKPEYADLDVDYYFLEMDGIPVPFFVQEFTGVTDTTVRVKFMDVEDEKSASRLVNKRVLLLRETVKTLLGQEEGGWGYFIGFELEDQHGVRLGTIREVDNATINVLFVVALDDNERLIPATEDFILSIDEKRGMIKMNLPEGLLDG